VVGENLYTFGFPKVGRFSPQCSNYVEICGTPFPHQKKKTSSAMLHGNNIPQSLPPQARTYPPFVPSLLSPLGTLPQPDTSSTASTQPHQADKTEPLHPSSAQLLYVILYVSLY
jgi:hypothetical protein